MKKTLILILAGILLTGGCGAISGPISNEQKEEIVEIKKTEDIDINTEKGREHYKTTAEIQLRHAKEYDEQGMKLNAMFCYFEAGERFAKIREIDRAKECYNYLVNSLYSEKADQLFHLIDEAEKARKEANSKIEEKEGINR